ncbi:MAG: ketol-acid reductoisomerase, partial [Planctomycetota bacterium]
MLDENAKSHVGFDWSGRRVAIVGYGSQGRAHALNLRDSGVDVVVGARVDGPGWARATEDGFQPQSVGAAVCEAELVAILTPDLAQPKLFLEEIQPNLADGATVLFAHGFCVRFGFIEVPTAHDLIMVAPKAPGPLVRREFERGFGVPCLVACENDASGRGVEKARGYAHCLGGTRAGLVETDFAEETETDLFGEQAVLCGGVTELIAAGFETLTEAGYRPEV